MTDAITTLGPLFAFMLIPLWIPMIAIAVGKLGDVVSPRGEHPVALKIRESKHAAAPHAHVKAQPVTQAA
ncbi:MAG TPA: hypothetical protein VLI04_17665 [Nocardioidaceae bacterium]|nr:hypothetical protein [Nocardioidaceae bacterium]